MSGDIKAKWEFRIFFPLDDSGQLPFNIFQVLGTAPTETERGRIDEYVPVSSTVGVRAEANRLATSRCLLPTRITQRARMSFN